MRTDIFYYITKNIRTKEERVFTFDYWAGDIGDYIWDENIPYEIIDYTWEFEDLEDQRELVY